MLEFLLTICDVFCSALAAMSSNWKEAISKVSNFILAVIEDLEGSAATRSGGLQYKITCSFAQGS